MIDENDELDLTRCRVTCDIGHKRLCFASQPSGLLECDPKPNPRCSVATLTLPKQVPLHLNVIGTQKGRWLVRVESVLAASECEDIALQMVLEHLPDDGRGSTRRLYMVCLEHDLHESPQRVLIADRIRQWLESTEGNGVLNLEQEAMYGAGISI
jgi:hypothetical protein